ncbi:MAG TPA: glycosyltransferase family 4 protein [Saprospiraceae bacterium]|nr:glycosyltransferase family 4 protein [Saprospiraceae bacterium]HRP40801.1 glycosyltransferase family 4 protein [Saprospiraceae bacterium]
MSDTKRILFVGSFKSQAKDGSVGGQMYACKTLLNSSLKDKYQWILIDSTADSNIKSSIFKRVYKSIIRSIRYIYYILFKNVDICLIFTGDGFSFIEKGTMGMLSIMLNKKVILSPRSGIVVKDYESSRFYRWFYPFVLNNMTNVVCQGASWYSFYKQIAPTGKYTVIENWLDTDPYLNIVRSEDKSTINIGFMSWVDTNKGVFELINVFLKIVSEYESCILHIAGDGEAMQQVQLFVKNHKLESKVVFHGWVMGDVKYKFLSELDIYILPSYYEGFPNSLMEAMASGLACIATNVGAIPDLIENGKHGLIIKPKDSIELYNAMKLLILNPIMRENLGIQAKKRILSNNTPKHGAVAFEKVLSDVINNKF